MDNSAVKSQFTQILTAAKERRGDLSVDTMIVSSHLAQMKTFMLRRGIEFYAEQDSFGSRKDFIAKVCEDNMLEMKLDSIVDYFLCDGQGLFYFRPTGDNYQLLYFPKDSYRAYRDQAGELESVVLIYHFNVRRTNALDAYPTQDGRGGKKKWIQLKVYKDRIEQTISDEKIDFENEMGANMLKMPGQTETLVNSLGYIPAVEVFNHMDCTGEATGNGEFDWLAHQILYHDELVRNVRKNMKFFGNPTLVSSRPKHDILDSDSDNTFRPTISSQAGFTPLAGLGGSTRVSQPFGSSSVDGQIKVPRVIANLEPTDRVQYMTPDAVSGDQNLYVKQYRSEIRLALGGVDDIDIGTASTAYEIKTLYGRVAATAEKKTRAMFTYGLSKLFSMMIFTEEDMFRRSFAAALGMEEPEQPLPEDFGGDIDAYEKASVKYTKEYEKFVTKRDETLRVTLDGGDIPPGVTGLIPDGNTKVSWRWMGEVFEESTDDILNNSIVVRNLQELGVDSIEALKYLFPGKTDEERAAMLSGYPFRMVQQTQQSINSFIGLLGNLYQLPHPQMPDKPLASDPNLDLTGFLYRSLEFLRKELSYSGRYKPDSSSSNPDQLSTADRLRASRGTPVRDEPVTSLPGIDGPTSGASNAGLPGTGPGSAGFGSGGQSMAAGVSGAQRVPEYKQPIPGPGFTLGLSGDTNASGSYTAELGFNGGPSGSPDLQSPSFNPGLLGIGSEPAGSAGSSTRTSTGERRVPKRNQRRKS
jgi:hypothetical protein